MPLARISGGHARVSLLARRRVGVDQHQTAAAVLGPLEPGSAQTVDAGRRARSISSSSCVVAGVTLVGVGDGLEVEVVDERALLHAAHLEPQGQASRVGLLSDRLLHDLERLGRQGHDGGGRLEIFGGRCHDDKSTALVRSPWSRGPTIGVAGCATSGGLPGQPAPEGRTVSTVLGSPATRSGHASSEPSPLGRAGPGWAGRVGSSGASRWTRPSSTDARTDR